MTKPKVPRRRREGPGLVGRRREATFDPSGTYAPPHNLGHVPTEQPIYDSRDATSQDGVYGDSVSGDGAFDADGFDAGAFNTGALNTQVFNQPPIIEPKHAPETVPPPSPGAAPISYGGGANPATRPRATHAPPPVPTVRGRGVYPPNQPPTFNKEVVTFHVRALIAAFEEIETYEPARHHNSKPAVWSDDPDFAQDVRALLSELRRLNDLLEAGREPSPTAASKMGKILVQGASTVFKVACATVGAGLGYVILGSFAEVLAQLGLRTELDAILSWGPKVK